MTILSAAPVTSTPSPPMVPAPATSPPVATRPTALANASTLLRALGTPHRLAIVLELCGGPRCVHELVDRLAISQSLASQHLRVLRENDLVTAARRGKEIAYSLADEHVGRMALDALAHGRRGVAPTATPGAPSRPLTNHSHDQEGR